MSGPPQWYYHSSPPAAYADYRPQIPPFAQESQSGQPNYPWPPPPSYHHPSRGPPSGPLSVPAHSSHVPPSQPQSQHSSKSADLPPIKPPTDEQLRRVVRHYLFSDEELRSPVVRGSNLVVIYGLREDETAATIGSGIGMFMTDKRAGSWESYYDDKVVRTWLIRSRAPGVEHRPDGTLRPSSGNLASTTALGCSWRFALASFIDPATAYCFYKQSIGKSLWQPVSDSGAPVKVEMANPLKTFVRLDPDDPEEAENMRYSWKGIGRKGWDGIYREGHGSDTTYWCIEDDRVGVDCWENPIVEKGQSGGASGLREDGTPSRIPEWSSEDDEAPNVNPNKGNSNKQVDASRKKPRLEQNLNSEDSASSNANDKTERSRKVPQLAGSKKVAKDISKWQNKQTELHKDPDVSPNTQVQSSKSSSSPSTNASASASLAASMPKEVPTDYDFSDTVKKACLLCQRQFKTLETLRRHETESELHKKNLSDDSVRKAGFERKNPEMSKDVPAKQVDQKPSKGFAPVDATPTSTSAPIKLDISSSSTPDTSLSSDSSLKYRDRASERRLVFGADNPPSSSRKGKQGPRAFLGPTPIMTEALEKQEETDRLARREAEQRQQQEEISESNNVGAKMLAQMGWAKGKGLGTEFQGRSLPVEAGSHRMGAGLGSGNASVNGERGGNPNDREGYGEDRYLHRDWNKDSRGSYLEAMRDSARERFGER